MALVTYLTMRNPRSVHHICMSRCKAAALNMSSYDYEATRSSSEHRDSTIAIRGNPALKQKNNGSGLSNSVSDMLGQQNCIPPSDNIHLQHVVSIVPVRKIGKHSQVYHSMHAGICMSGQASFQDIPRYLSTWRSSSKGDVDMVIDMMAETDNGAVHSEMMAGKGKPPPPPTDCCNAGCVDCVWLQHIHKLHHYYGKEKGNVKALAAIDNMDDPQLKLFLKIELGLIS